MNVELLLKAKKALKRHKQKYYSFAKERENLERIISYYLDFLKSLSQEVQNEINQSLDYYEKK